MSILRNNTTKKIIKLLKAQGFALMLYNEQGMAVTDIADAYMVYVPSNKLMITLVDDTLNTTISNDDISTLRNLLRSIRTIATKNNFIFTLHEYGADMTPKDFAFLAKPITESGEKHMTPEIKKWSGFFKALDEMTAGGQTSLRKFGEPDEEKARWLTKDSIYDAQAERWVDGSFGNGNSMTPKEPENSGTPEMDFMNFVSNMVRMLPLDDTIVANILSRIADQMSHRISGANVESWFTSEANRRHLKAFALNVGKRLGVQPPRVLPESVINESFDDKSLLEGNMAALAQWEDEQEKHQKKIDALGEWFNVNEFVDDTLLDLFGVTSFDQIPDDQKAEFEGAILDYFPTDADLNARLTWYAETNTDDLVSDMSGYIEDVKHELMVRGFPMTNKKDSFSEFNEWVNSFEPDAIFKRVSIAEQKKKNELKRKINEMKRSIKNAKLSKKAISEQIKKRERKAMWNVATSLIESSRNECVKIIDQMETPQLRVLDDVVNDVWASDISAPIHNIIAETLSFRREMKQVPIVEEVSEFKDIGIDKLRKLSGLKEGINTNVEFFEDDADDRYKKLDDEYSSFLTKVFADISRLAIDMFGTDVEWNDMDIHSPGIYFDMDHDPAVFHINWNYSGKMTNEEAMHTREIADEKFKELGYNVNDDFYISAPMTELVMTENKLDKHYSYSDINVYVKDTSLETADTVHDLADELGITIDAIYPSEANNGLVAIAHNEYDANALIGAMFEKSIRGYQHAADAKLTERAMNESYIDPSHVAQIKKIVNRFVKAAKRSNKETAWQDAERKGMDAVRKYCRENGLPVFGDHMIAANNALHDGTILEAKSDNYSEVTMTIKNPSNDEMVEGILQYDIDSMGHVTISDGEKDVYLQGDDATEFLGKLDIYKDEDALMQEYQHVMEAEGSKYTIVENPKKQKFYVKDENGNIVSSHKWRRFAEEKIDALMHVMEGDDADNTNTKYGMASKAGIENRLKSRHDWIEGLELWHMMLERAKTDKRYDADLHAWIMGENNKSTVFLRDILAEPFRKEFDDREDHLVFFNAWCAVDSARHNNANKLS